MIGKWCLVGQEDCGGGGRGTERAEGRGESKPYGRWKQNRQVFHGSPFLKVLDGESLIACNRHKRGFDME